MGEQRSSKIKDKVTKQQMFFQHASSQHKTDARGEPNKKLAPGFSHSRTFAVKSPATERGTSNSKKNKKKEHGGLHDVVQVTVTELQTVTQCELTNRTL